MTFPPGGNRRETHRSHGNRFSSAFGFLLLLVFSVPTERAAIANGNDLRGLGICHQQAFWQEVRERIPAKIRNLTEDCIACELCPEFGTKKVIPNISLGFGITKCSEVGSR